MSARIGLIAWKVGRWSTWSPWHRMAPAFSGRTECGLTVPVDAALAHEIIPADGRPTSGACEHCWPTYPVPHASDCPHPDPSLAL
jgi:hypothetical protein